MKSLIFQFLASIVVFVSLSLTQDDGEGGRRRPIKEVIRSGGKNGEGQGPVGNNTGTAVVCGPKGAHLNLSWTPKIIDPDKSVMLYFNFTNPIDFNKGKADIDVYMEGSSDPIFSVVQDIACSEISKQLPFITCPMKKNENHVFSHKFDDLNRLPVGAYVIVVKILSYEGNPSFPLFACLNLTLHIVPSDQVLNIPAL